MGLQSPRYNLNSENFTKIIFKTLRAGKACHVLNSAFWCSLNLML